MADKFQLLPWLVGSSSTPAQRFVDMGDGTYAPVVATTTDPTAPETVQGRGTAGAPVGGVLSVQGVPLGTPVPTYPGNAQNIRPGSPTFVGTLAAITPYATPTDFMGLRNPVGSGKVIQIRYAAMLANSTSASVINFYGYRRSAFNTGGAPTTLDIATSDSADAAPVGVPLVYTSAPAITDATPKKLIISAGSSASLSAAPANVQLGSIMGLPIQLGTDQARPLTIRPGEEFVINLNSAAWGAAMSIIPVWQWTESPI